MDVEPIGYTLENHRENLLAKINVCDAYAEGLKRIDENSHLWILSWFDQADRSKLTTTLTKLESKVSPMGVFSLRNPSRPNPIALSLVELVKVKNTVLYVKNFDAFEGTPILDIKPYYEKDTIFSPKTPDIWPKYRERKINRYTSLAMNHHQEKCLGLIIGVKMSLLAEKHLGILTNPKVKIDVEGSNCLIDTLQATTSARFANPARLTINNREDSWISRWKVDEKEIEIWFDCHKQSTTNLKEVETISEDKLFTINLY